MAASSRWVGSGSTWRPGGDTGSVTSVTAGGGLQSSGGDTPQISPTAAMQDRIAGVPDISVGTETDDVIAVTVQLKNNAGDDLEQRTLGTCWLSDAAYEEPSGTQPDVVGVVTGTLLGDVAGLMTVLSDENGVIALDIEDAGTGTFYLNVAVGAQVVASAAITFGA